MRTQQLTTLDRICRLIAAVIMLQTLLFKFSAAEENTTVTQWLEIFQAWYYAYKNNINFRVSFVK